MLRSEVVHVNHQGALSGEKTIQTCTQLGALLLPPHLY